MKHPARELTAISCVERHATQASDTTCDHFETSEDAATREQMTPRSDGSISWNLQGHACQTPSLGTTRDFRKAIRLIPPATTPVRSFPRTRTFLSNEGTKAGREKQRGYRWAEKNA